MVSPENTNYWSSFDYATLINDIPAPNGPYSGFSWPTRPINASSNVFSVFNLDKEMVCVSNKLLSWAFG
uniref:Uncharacterized protein n=1 Tax=Gossypium raimondii TaxID=29730 RepID=A0A0D2TQ60_GOSRA|nr:hypothetical protein B456_007G315200 [Gossypium raimondii]